MEIVIIAGQLETCDQNGDETTNNDKDKDRDKDRNKDKEKDTDKDKDMNERTNSKSEMDIFSTREISLHCITD